MKILGIVVAVILMISLATYFTLMDSKRIKKLHLEYENVNYNDDFKGKVDGLYVEKGACFVSIGSKKIFLKESINYLYQEIYLDKILSIGDSIIKEQRSDTIKIIKKNSEYQFVIGKIINKQ